MGEQDVMRLAAEVVDKYSGPLKDMTKQLRTLSDFARGVHGAGAKSVTEHEKAYSRLRDTIEKVHHGVSSALTPSMAALGITALSVGGAIGAVVNSVIALGTSSQHFDQLGRRSGFALQSIRELEAGFVRMGMTVGQADETIAGFGSLMDRFGRNDPTAIAQVNGYAGAFQNLRLSIKDMTDKSAALDKVLDWGDRNVANPDQLRELYKEFGITQQMADVRRKDRLEAIAAGKKDASDPFDIEKARTFQKSMNDLNAGFERLKLVLGTEFAPALTTILTKLTAFFGDKTNIDYFKEALLTTAGVIGDMIRGFERVIKFFNHGYALERLGLPQSAADPNKSPLPWGAGSDADAEKKIKKGTLDALRDWWGGVTGDEVASRGQGATGLTFRPHIRSGHGGTSGHAGGAYTEGSSVPPNSFVGGDVDASSLTPQLTPELRDRLAHIVQGETGRNKLGAQKILETVRNRALARNQTLADVTRQYTGPGSAGYYPSTTFSAGRWDETQFSEVLGKVFGPHGVNSSGLATGNASSTVATNGIRRGNFQNTSNLRTSGRGPAEAGLPGVETFGIDKDAGRNLNRLKQFWHPEGGTPAEAGGWSPGAKPIPHLDLLKLGKQSGLLGKVTGEASLSIDLNGFPRGTKTAMNYGGLFKEAKLNRGSPMAVASEG